MGPGNSGEHVIKRDDNEHNPHFTVRGIGLCASCVHSSAIHNKEGNTFWLCKMSEKDVRYPKYPRLPVLNCAGFERRSDIP